MSVVFFELTLPVALKGEVEVSGKRKGIKPPKQDLGKRISDAED